MGKYLAIAFIILAVGSAILVYIFTSGEPAPEPYQTPSQTNTNFINSTVSVPSNPEAPAVQAAFQKELQAQTESDHTILGDTVVVGDYALQSWKGDVMGGEALLKYDRTYRQWMLVEAGGGEWSVGVLVNLGVPQDVAEALLR